MKEATRKLLVAATAAAKNQVSVADVTEESWKFHAERLWVAVDVKHGYIFVADLGDEERLIVFKHEVHHALSPVEKKKDPTVAVDRETKSKKKDKSRK